MARLRDIREAAMQLLFAHELQGELGDSDRAAFWQLHSANERTRADAEKLTAEILGHLPEIDEAISGAVVNFSFERINAVDRNVLRLGVYELLHKPEVPVPVVINEAIEIARRFATEESGKFVNGVLDRIAKSRPVNLKAPVAKSKS
jgi:transcription antitermination protein NusB